MFSLTVNGENGENILSDKSQKSCSITNQQKDELDIYFVYENGDVSCFNVDSLETSVLTYFNKHAK